MRDPYGLVPPHIKANYEADEMADRAISHATSLFKELRSFDNEIVDVRFYTERAQPIHGIKPGRWHVVRRNAPPAPDSYFPIETPAGGYREPDSGVLDELRARDLRNRTVWERIEQEHRDKKPSALQEPDYTDDGSAEEIAHDVRAASRVAGEGGMHARKWAKR